MFLKLSIPDKPTYYPIVPPDEALVKLCEEFSKFLLVSSFLKIFF